MKLDGFRELQIQKTREMWHATRWSAHAVIMPHLKRGSRLKETDLIRFPWESKTVDFEAIKEFVTKNKSEFDKLPQVTRMNQGKRKLDFYEAQKMLKNNGNK